MTILPKKKQQKDKSDGETAEKPHSPGNQADSRNTRHSSPGPSQWAPSVGQLNDADDPVCHPSAVVGISNKRRLRDRSPTHRSLRKQRHENTVPSGLQGRALSCNAQIGLVRPNSSRISSVLSPSTSTDPNWNAQLIGGAPSADYEESNNGYNSEDECGPQDPRDNNYDDQLERWFEAMLKEQRGFVIKKMGDDGACLFRAVADQVYGDQEMHDVVRQNCVDYMSKNVDFFKSYVTEDFNTYLTRKRTASCHGNHVEMQALSELYNRPVEVYQCRWSDQCSKPINTFHGAYKTDNAPIRLSYHKNIHYNSVIDPCKPTIGVGLGLPGLQPGLADKNLIRDAVKMSENCEIEQTMLEDKLKETDWEVTQETIEEQVARESYLQWLKDQEKYNKNKASPRSASASCSTAAEASNWWGVPVATETGARYSPHRSSAVASTSATATAAGGSSPRSCSGVNKCDSAPQLPSTSKAEENFTNSDEATGGNTFSETASIMNELPPQLYGFGTEFDDEDAILAHVIAQSQQEYFNSLKKSPPSDGSPQSSFSVDKGKSPMPRESRP